MDDFDAIWQNMVKSLRILLHIPKKSSNFAPEFLSATMEGILNLCEILDFRGIGGIGRRARLRIWFREE